MSVSWFTTCPSAASEIQEVSVARITNVKVVGAFVASAVARRLSKVRTVTSVLSEAFGCFAAAIADCEPGWGSGVEKGLAGSPGADDGIETAEVPPALGSLGVGVAPAYIPVDDVVCALFSRGGFACSARAF